MPITHEIAWLRLLHGRTHRGLWRESAPGAAPLAGRVDGSPESLRRPPLTHPTGAGDTVMKRIGNKDGNLKARANVTCRFRRIWCKPYFSLCVLMIQESLSQLIFSPTLLGYFVCLCILMRYTFVIFLTVSWCAKKCASSSVWEVRSLFSHRQCSSLQICTNIYQSK